MLRNIQQILIEFYPLLLKGLGITLLLSFITVFFGAFIGFFVSFLTMSKNKILKYIGVIYVEVIRGVPLLLQLLIIYFALPSTINKFIAASIALVINSGAYVSEIFRAGIQAVDKGQTEAARSLGLNKHQTMFKVILPQAIKNILPAIGNEYVTVIKETSLASTFFVGDLMTAHKTISGITFWYLEAYIVVSIFYLVTTFTLSSIIRAIEKGMKASD